MAAGRAEQTDRKVGSDATTPRDTDAYDPPYFKEIRPEFHLAYAQLNGNATCQLDRDGKTIQVNTVMPRLLGIEPEKLTGTRFLDLFQESDRDRVAPILERPPTETTHLASLTLTPKEGGPITVDLTMIPLHDESGNDRGTFVVIHDRDQPKSTMDDSSAYREILESISDAVIMTDREGALLHCNTAAELLFGYKRTEIVGENGLRLLFTQHEPEAYDEIASRLKDGDAYHGDYLMRRKDGTRILADLHGAPILDHEKQILGSYMVCRNITATERPESDKRKAKSPRQKKPAQEEQFLGRGRLIIEGVQEVKNPLTTVLMQVHLLKEKLSPEEAPHLAGYLDIMERNLIRSSTLLTNMLEAVQIERHRIRMAPHSIHLDDFLQEIKQDLRPAARTVGVRIILDLDPNIQFYGDARRISQVFTTIIKNGLKYTPPGGFVRVTATENGEDTDIKIQDNGIGLRPEETEQIFQPFPLIGAKKREGTGLSLYIAKGIVEGHGGQISCTSAGRDKGTTFTIALPQKESARALPD